MIQAICVNKWAKKMHWSTYWGSWTPLKKTRERNQTRSIETGRWNKYRSIDHFSPQSKKKKEIRSSDIDNGKKKSFSRKTNNKRSTLSLEDRWKRIEDQFPFPNRHFLHWSDYFSTLLTYWRLDDFCSSRYSMRYLALGRERRNLFGWEQEIVSRRAQFLMNNAFLMPMRICLFT